MRQAKLLKLISAALLQVRNEIRANASGGIYGAGLSAEGYAGGYRDALSDVEAIARHGYPSDTRGYFRKALAAERDAEGRT